MNERMVLPTRRPNRTYELTFGNQNSSYSITTGYYGKYVREVFISSAKVGSEMDAIARDSAILLSLCLQYGVNIETIAHALTRNQDGKVETIVGAVVDRIIHEEAQS